MSTNFKPVPTNRDLIAARQAQAPTSAPALRPVAEARAEYNASYRSRYLDEVAPASIAGRLAKFKDGQFITVDDGQPMPEGAEYVALCDETQVGWKKFNGAGEAPERHMGLLFDNFEMPSRESLGDLDPATWELGLDNQPQDPWQHEINIVLQSTATQELFTFTTSSKTGRRAVGNLLRHFERMQRSRSSDLPVVRLATGGYKHSDARVGFVSTPVFVVVGRAPRDGAAKSNGALNDPMPNF
ncbi:MAG: hypothetical protein ACAI18_18605 [Gemmatimonadales bacterium]